MKIRKMFALVSGVLLLASCEFMNQKDNLIKNSEKETPVVYVDNGEDLTEVQTGVLVLNIAGTTARMIRPEFNFSEYTDWQISFGKEFQKLDNSNQKFVLPIGSYTVSVKAFRYYKGQSGEKVLASTIVGVTDVTVDVPTENKPFSECNILMAREMNDEETGSFQYLFTIPAKNFSAYYDESNPDFNPKKYVVASLTGLSVEQEYVFNNENEDGVHVECTKATVEEISEDYEGKEITYKVEVFNFCLKGENLLPGYYRLKIDFETSNNIYVDSDEHVTSYYTKALFEYPDNLVEILPDEVTFYDSTIDEKICYEEFNSDNPISLKELSKLLITCSKNDERVLEINNLKEASDYFPVSKLNDLIIKKGIKVDVTMPEYFDETSSFKDNPYLYGVTFESSGYFILPSGFFKNCSGLKYVRFQHEISIKEGNKYPWLEIKEGAFEGCSIITFQVPEESRELYNQIFMDYFGEGNYKIESIQPYFDLFETK
ncbi:MAG: leucine-rich repeat domain-containing protein [Treponema sp.]|nr:leucine-rich repeat domain-containing protein [Treponema sp.]